MKRLGSSVTVGDLEGDPHALFAQLRACEPVSWVPALGGWLVTSRDLAIEAMLDPDTFTVDDPRFSTSKVVGPSMLSTDGSEHTRHRQPFAVPFRAAVVHAEFSTWVDAEARALVNRFAERGSGDLRDELAAPLAVSTVTRALDLVDADPQTILGWYRHIVGSVTELGAGREATTEGAHAFDSLRSAVERTTEVSSASILTAAANTGSLSMTEVVGNAAVLMFGAIETSDGMTSTALFHLLKNRDQLERLRADRELLANAIEESLRLEPAVASVDRYVTHDVVLGETPLARGDYVSVSLAGANRDPSMFTDPDRFDIGRHNARQHVSFVHGSHACLGLHLAKLETRAAIDAVLDLLPDVGLADDARGPRGFIFRKPANVMALWTPE